MEPARDTGRTQAGETHSSLPHALLSGSAARFCAEASAAAAAATAPEDRDRAIRIAQVSLYLSCTPFLFSFFSYRHCYYCDYGRDRLEAD